MAFTQDEIKDRMSKYGTVFFPDDIKDVPEDLVGIDQNIEMLEDFFKTMQKYKTYADKLKKVRMTPSITALLYGPPGTGKTSLTRAMAKKFDIPMCVVEADRLVSPLLGDTLKNMRNVVELAAEIAKENKIFLLFFDELDAIASERSNVHEVGEIKRGVISFLQIIDKVDYEGIPLAIFGATNHQGQLDSAVWRRFNFHLYFGFPNFSIRKEILIKYLERLKKGGIKVDQMIWTNLESEEKTHKNEFKKMKEQSMKSINSDEFEDKWSEINGGKQIGLLTLTRGYTGADLERGIRVSLFKAIQKDILEFEDLFNALKFVGGTRIHVEDANRLAEIGDKSSKKDNKPLNNRISAKNKGGNRKKPFEI
jgi:SpoVK/Ycf46/Vps4 family AAA+-type ATPase